MKEQDIKTAVLPSISNPEVPFNSNVSSETLMNLKYLMKPPILTMKPGMQLEQWIINDNPNNVKGQTDNRSVFIHEIEADIEFGKEGMWVTGQGRKLF